MLLSRILKMLILLWKFVHCVCLKGHSQQYISKATSYFILHAHCTFSRLTAQSAYFTHKLQLHLLGTKKHKYINKGPIVYYIKGRFPIRHKNDGGFGLMEYFLEGSSLLEGFGISQLRREKFVFCWVTLLISNVSTY